MLTLFCFILFSGIAILLLKRFKALFIFLKSDIGWILLICFVVINFALSAFISSTFLSALFPLKSDYGITYNAERESKQIPLLGNNWRETKEMGSRFRIWYLNPIDSTIHQKKRIELDNWGAVYEEDYFKNTLGDELISVHDYDLKTNTYYFVKPTYSAQLLKHLNPRLKITKRQFSELLKN